MYLLYQLLITDLFYTIIPITWALDASFLTGDTLKSAAKYLIASVMAGFLKTAKVTNGDPVTLNLVNAPVFAKQAGIVVSIYVIDWLMVYFVLTR